MLPLFSEDINILDDMDDWEKDAIKRINGAFKSFVEANAHLHNVVREVFQTVSQQCSIRRFKYSIPQKENDKKISVQSLW